MTLAALLRARRTIKRFTSRPVTRDEIEALIDAAVQAPNHRMTQPWHFYVMGVEARRAYGLALGARKAGKIDDPDAARAVEERVAAAEVAIPAELAVTMQLNENPEIREEDYAATMMAVENLLLMAQEMGLGTHLRTGAVMADPCARAAIGVTDGERIVALIQIGEPAETPEPRPRRAGTECTTWIP